MSPTSHRRLLIVDDDLAICTMLADIAQMMGYDADIASTPDQMDQLVGTGHDLVMLDLALGETDGMRVMRTLAERQPGANLVLLTGADVSVLSGARRVAEMSGFNVVGACGKPASIAEIEAVLRFDETATASDDERTDEQLEQQVLAALDRGQFHLLYQPIVSLTDDLVVGAEALVRLDVPGLETVSPEIWVPIIERAGRSRDLLDVVFRIAAHERFNVPALTTLQNISLNVSVLDLDDTGLPEHAERMLADCAPPSAWTLEITETAEVQRLMDSLDVLVRLRIKGFRLSMDDFGSGASTLNRLRELPFTSLKADRRFMQTDFDDHDHAISMLKAAVELGAALNLVVVAEGVETAEEIEAAKAVGCDYAQGYHIGRPVRAEAFGVLVASWHLSSTKF